MFGYIQPKYNSLTKCDFNLYRSFYCGICKAIGKEYGTLPRLTTNYDITFLAIFLTAATNTKTEFKKENCILEWFRKKEIVKENALFSKLSATNIILAYYKAIDGVVDKEGLKMKIRKRLLSKPYKKAKEIFPKADEIVKEGYENLRKLEKEGCESLDRVSDCFSLILKNIIAEFIGEEIEYKNELLSLGYNIGKFVYLSDAVDDIEKDKKKKRYNPFLFAYKDFTSKKEFVIVKKDELEFSFASCINRTIECFNTVRHKLYLGTSLLQNIIHLGLKDKVEELLRTEKKKKEKKRKTKKDDRPI